MSLHKSSVAADHGVVEGDVIIGAGVHPVGEMGGKVPVITGAVKQLLPSCHTRVMRDGYLCVFWRD